MNRVSKVESYDIPASLILQDFVIPNTVVVWYLACIPPWCFSVEVHFGLFSLTAMRLVSSIMDVQTQECVESVRVFDIVSFTSLLVAIFARMRAQNEPQKQW